MRKKCITITISIDIIDSLRNIVFWTPGMTISAFVEETIAQKIKILTEENPHISRKRPHQLARGRKISL